MLSEKEFQKLIKPLPSRISEKISYEEITKPWLEEEIAKAKQEMKNDMYFGIPWVFLYSLSLFSFGMSYGTVLIFLIGAVYFVYAIVKRGTYGTLSRKVAIFEELLTKMK